MLASFFFFACFLSRLRVRRRFVRHARSLPGSVFRPRLEEPPCEVAGAVPFPGFVMCTWIGGPFEFARKLLPPPPPPFPKPAPPSPPPLPLRRLPCPGCPG